VQFAGQIGPDGFALNRFWPRIRDRYPDLATQPALPAMREDFGPNPGVAFNLIGGPVLPMRFWFLSSDGSEVVQVQADRLAFNWRREPSPGVIVGDYPRYEHVREKFDAILGEFLDEASESGITAAPNWCEIAYINQVPGRNAEGPMPLSSILRLVQSLPLEKLGPAEDTAFGQRHILMREGQPFGRFYIEANRAMKVNPRSPFPEPIYVLSLTTRGLVEGPDKENIIDFMNYGRDLIVHTFRDVITDDMHDDWGLQ
jgi:uncharacterized protein (TIGR04255 family)